MTLEVFTKFLQAVTADLQYAEGKGVFQRMTDEQRRRLGVGFANAVRDAGIASDWTVNLLESNR